MDDNATTNGDLISKIVKSLREQSDADQDLVEILAEHIVRIDAAKSAVEGAAEAIEKLALKRGEQSNQ